MSGRKKGKTRVRRVRIEPRRVADRGLREGNFTGGGKLASQRTIWTKVQKSTRERGGD